jgi:hypothetical protein
VEDYPRNADAKRAAENLRAEINAAEQKPRDASEKER